MASDMDDPFTTPNKHSREAPVLDFDSPPILTRPATSPDQLKRTLQAHLAETRRRLDDTGKLGRNLVQQEEEIEARLKDLEESGGRIGPELRQKLADLEKDYNEVGRETVRALLTNKIMGGASPHGAPNHSSNSAMLQSQGTSSPSKPNVATSRRQRNQPSKTHDLEFAAELGQGLIAEVRKLQALLSEREETLKVVQLEKSRLEQHVETIETRLRSLDDSEQRYKEENWNLELMIQDLHSQQSSHKEIEAKLQSTVIQLEHEKTMVIKELDDVKAQFTKVSDELEAKTKQDETEIGSLRRALATTDTEKTLLGKKVEELKVELDEAQKTNMRLRIMNERQAEEEKNDSLTLELPDDDTPDHSPPPSPTKHTPRHGQLEVETLKSSLNHAHRMIQNLKQKVRAGETRNNDLERLLREARDELEGARAFASPPQREKRRRPDGTFKKLPRPSVALLGIARKSRDEVVSESPISPLGDDEWEEAHEDDVFGRTPGAYVSSVAPTDVDETDAGFETANERDSTDVFDTAAENDNDATETETYRTGLESPLNDGPTSADDLTETEASRRTRPKISPRNARPMRLQKLRQQRDSIVSTASTDEEYDDGFYRYHGSNMEEMADGMHTPEGQEYDDDYLKTPEALKNPRLKLRINRGRGKVPQRMPSGNSMFNSRVFSPTSPASFTSPSSMDASPRNPNFRSSTVPNMAKSLFAELGNSPGMMSQTSGDEDVEDTPSKKLSPSLMPREMVDCGVMTEVPYPDIPVLLDDSVSEASSDRPSTAVTVVNDSGMLGFGSSPDRKPLLEPTQETVPETFDAGVQSEPEEKPVLHEIGVQSDEIPAPAMSEIGTQSDEEPAMVTSDMGTQSDVEPAPITTEMGTQSEEEPVPVTIEMGTQSEDEPVPITIEIGTQSDEEPAPAVSEIGTQSELAPVLEIGTQSEPAPISEIGTQSEPAPITTETGTQSDKEPVPVTTEMGTQSDEEPVPAISETGTQFDPELEPAVVVKESADNGTQFDPEIEKVQDTVEEEIPVFTIVEGGSVTTEPVEEEEVAIVTVAPAEEVPAFVLVKGESIETAPVEEPVVEIEAPTFDLVTGESLETAPVEPVEVPLALDFAGIVAESTEPISPVLPPLDFAGIVTESTEPVSPILPAVALDFAGVVTESTEPVSPVLPPLDFAGVVTESTEPVSPVLPSVALDFAGVVTESTEPESPILPPLDFTGVVAESTEPVSPALPPLDFAGVVAESTEPVSPVLSPVALDFADIVTESTEPVSPVLPTPPVLSVPEPVALDFSDIMAESTEPVSPVLPTPSVVLSLPTPTAVAAPTADAAVSSDEDMPKKVSEQSPSRPTTPTPSIEKRGFFGSLFGSRKQTTPNQHTLESKKSLSLDSDASDGTDDTIRQKDAPTRPTLIFTAESGVQTDLSSDFFNPKETQAPKRSVLIGTGTMTEPSILAETPSLRSITSFESVGLGRNSRLGDGGVRLVSAESSLVRPESSSSMREHLMRGPPLPENHEERIAATQHKIGAATDVHEPGLMGPPPVPTQRSNVSFRPRTPAQYDQSRPGETLASTSLAGSTSRAATRFSATRSEISSPGSRRSSLSSFVTELDDRFNMQNDGYPARNGDAQNTATDPRVIQAITQTMIGEYLWKYTRNTGRGSMSHTRHKRFFWIHPYTRTLYWSDRDPQSAGRAELRAKSVAIEAVRVVTDDNPMPPGLHRKSLVIITPGRTLKFTAPTSQRHETWFSALSYLLLRDGQDGAVDDTAELNDDDYATGGYATEGSLQPTVRPAASFSSFRSRATRDASPVRNASSLSTRRPGERERAQGSLSRLSNIFRPASALGSYSSRNENSVYGISESGNSGEDLQAQIERQELEAERMENVRACCDGKHDVGTLSRKGGKKVRARGMSHGHSHSHG